MMPYIIRSDEEMIFALRRWLSQSKLPKDEVVLEIGEARYTIPQIMEAVKDPNSPIYQMFVVNFKEIAKRYGTDPLDLMHSKS